MIPHLRLINLVLAYVATVAPVAHVLEMRSKLALSGPLWLAVQQNLYRGWGGRVRASGNPRAAHVGLAPRRIAACTSRTPSVFSGLVVLCEHDLGILHF